MNLTLKRILAFLIDYILIILYAGLLFVMFKLIEPSVEFDKYQVYKPIRGQAIGFVSLTFPVFLYSILSENSLWKATLGKRIQKIKVKTNSNYNNYQILKRNILKYFPWEIAHTGIHWMFYYNSLNLETPLWVWFLLIFPQIIVVVYFLSIISKNGKQSLYDFISKTKIIHDSVLKIKKSRA